MILFDMTFNQKTPINKLAPQKFNILIEHKLIKILMKITFSIWQVGQ